TEHVISPKSSFRDNAPRNIRRLAESDTMEWVFSLTEVGRTSVRIHARHDSSRVRSVINEPPVPILELCIERDALLVVTLVSTVRDDPTLDEPCDVVRRLAFRECLQIIDTSDQRVCVT